MSVNEVRQSLLRLKSTFYGDYGAAPLYEGERKVGKITQVGRTLFITFRGSVGSFREVLSCFDMRKASLEKWGLSGKVHRGIYNSFCQVQKSIDASWGRHFSHLDPHSIEWVIEGYSRGSALATLTAAYLAHKFATRHLKVFTFSTMNIFDQTAAEDYQQKVAAHTSFLCTRDLFPRYFGSPCLGFHSVGTKIPFSPDTIPSFAERVRQRAYTHLTRHWLLFPLTRLFLPIRFWESHMPEVYEDGALLALTQRQKPSNFSPRSPDCPETS